MPVYRFSRNDVVKIKQRQSDKELCALRFKRPVGSNKGIMIIGEKEVEVSLINATFTIAEGYTVILGWKDWVKGRPEIYIGLSDGLYLERD